MCACACVCVCVRACVRACAGRSPPLTFVWMAVVAAQHMAMQAVLDCRVLLAQPAHSRGHSLREHLWRDGVATDVVTMPQRHRVERQCMYRGVYPLRALEWALEGGWLCRGTRVSVYARRCRCWCWCGCGCGCGCCCGCWSFVNAVSFHTLFSLQQCCTAGADAVQAREHHGISFHGEAGEGLAAVFTDLRHSILRESIHLLGLGKVRCAVSDESHAAENERERERAYTEQIG